MGCVKLRDWPWCVKEFCCSYLSLVFELTFAFDFCFPCFVGITFYVI